MTTKTSDADHIFVNYTHPSHRLCKKNRVTVASFVNGQYRRKSKQIVLPDRGHLVWQLGRAREIENNHNQDGKPVEEQLESRNGHADPRDHQDLDNKLLVTRCFGGLRADPFNSFPIESGLHVHNAIDYYIQTWAPSQVPVLVAQQIENPLLSKLFPLALQNVELFEAMVCLSYSYHLAHAQRAAEPSQKSMYHRGNALTKLRAKLMSPDAQADDSSILTTILLMGTDYLFGDDQAYEAHLKGLSQMIDLRGGLDELGMGGSIKAFVLQVEFYWTLMSGKKSAHSNAKRDLVLDYPQPPYSPELRAIMMNLPEGFRDIALQRSLSIQVLRILERTSAWIAHLDRAQSQKPTPAEMQYLLLYDPRLDGEEATFCLNLTKPGTIEQCLCLGLVAYNLNVYNQARLSPAYQKMLRKFACALDLFTPSNESEKECYMWILAVAANASRGCPIEYEFRFAAQLHTLLPEKYEWTDLRAIFAKFLWYGPIGQVWERCFIEYMKQRKEPITTLRTTRL